MLLLNFLFKYKQFFKELQTCKSEKQGISLVRNHIYID